MSWHSHWCSRTQILQLFTDSAISVAVFAIAPITLGFGGLYLWHWQLRFCLLCGRKSCSTLCWTGPLKRICLDGSCRVIETSEVSLFNPEVLFFPAGLLWLQGCGLISKIKPSWAWSKVKLRSTMGQFMQAGMLNREGAIHAVTVSVNHSIPSVPTKLHIPHLQTATVINGAEANLIASSCH